MITVGEATDIISAFLFKPRVRTVPLTDCIGRVLAEEIVAVGSVNADVGPRPDQTPEALAKLAGGAAKSDSAA